MKLNEAISILLHHTRRDFVGAGRGVRSIPSEVEKKRAAEAIKRVWKRLYGFNPTENDIYNIIGF